jgi:hypothetical protein
MRKVKSLHIAIVKSSQAGQAHLSNLTSKPLLGILTGLFHAPSTAATTNCQSAHRAPPQSNQDQALISIGPRTLFDFSGQPSLQTFRINRSSFVRVIRKSWINQYYAKEIWLAKTYQQLAVPIQSLYMKTYSITGFDMLVFLGSGISLASGLPSVMEITNQLLNGDYIRDLDERGKFYASNDTKGKNVESIGNVQSLLHLLKNLDEHYLKTLAPYFSGDKYLNTGSIYRAVTGYEDLFHLCEQVRQSGAGLTDDAMTGGFCRFDGKGSRRHFGRQDSRTTAHFSVPRIGAGIEFHRMDGV